MEWNGEMDAGKPISQGVAERAALYPEYARDIEVYYARWIEMMGGQIEGMYELLSDLKRRGFRLYGLTNWSSETFPLVLLGLLFLILDPKIFRILLDRYRLDPSDCVFIDDRLPNVQAAEALGIKGILFSSAEVLRLALFPER